MTTNLLNKLIDNMVLLPDDAEHMRRRGFSDEVIHRKQWRSCHPGNEVIINSLGQDISELSQEGLLVSYEGAWVVNPKILTPNILIPYHDKDGNVTKVRPHKNGFQGHGHQVYRTTSSFAKCDVCVIAESEFKADAAECLGFPAIGIPGISSMEGKNFKYFLDVLDTIEANEFVICFDNELKDNPEYKSYKADWRKRFDTIIFAYAMAYKLLDHAKQCRVATLPAEWMVQGKIDIDLALAQGRTKEDFLDIIYKALPPKKYLDSLPLRANHKAHVNRSVKRLFYKSNIVVKGNCFWTIDTHDKRGEKVPGKRITNCYIYIKNVYENRINEKHGDGITRDVVIVDEFGNEILAPIVKAHHIGSRTGFNMWLMSRGNFLFYGIDNQVNDIMEYVFNNDNSDIVYCIDHCGYIKEYDFWLFENCLIKGGKVYPADEQGICWLDNIGYKCQVLNEIEALPSLVTEECKDFDLKKYIGYIGDTLDNDCLAKAVVAWALSTLFIKPIHQKYHCFPLLFLYGNKATGKTTILRWALALLGQENAQKNLDASSSVGITRTLGYYSSLPVLLNDWRETRKLNQMVPTLLGVYDRLGGAKGKIKFGLLETPIRAALAMTGEELINDNGLASRCLNFYMPENRRQERYAEMEVMSKQASCVARNILQQQPDVIPHIEDAVGRLHQLCTGVERRTLFNYAIPLGVCERLIGRDDRLTSFLSEQVLENARDITSGDKLHQFAEEFMIGVNEGIIQHHFYKYKDDGAKVVIYLRGVCDVLNKFYLRTETNISTLLAKYFQKKDFFIRAVSAMFPGSHGRLPSVELDVTKMPRTMAKFYEGAYSEETRSTFTIKSDEEVKDIPENVGIQSK